MHFSILAGISDLLLYIFDILATENTVPYGKRQLYTSISCCKSLFPCFQLSSAQQIFATQLEDGMFPLHKFMQADMEGLCCICTSTFIIISSP